MLFPLHASSDRLIKKVSDARRTQFDEPRRTLQYVEANRTSATKHVSLLGHLLSTCSVAAQEIDDRRMPLFRHFSQVAVPAALDQNKL